MRRARTVALQRRPGSVPGLVQRLPGPVAVRELVGDALLDGRRIRLSFGRTGLFSIDLTRSTGYHRLVLGGSSFWFGTEDAKLGLAGIESMLAELRTLGTGWTGQALFSDGAGLRDSHVLYAWLDQWADTALAAIDRVLTAPRAVVRSAQTLSRRGGRSVLVPATVRLLRSDPRRYLSPEVNGLIAVGTGRYDPLRVVVKSQTTDLDSVANRRAVSALVWLVRLTREVLDDRPAQDATVRCRLWLNRALTLARRPIARALTSSPVVGASSPRQAEEMLEQRYRVTYQVSRDLHRLFGWSATVAPQPRYSYVERADSIYQAYAASCLAAALGLKQTTPVLGSQPVAFTNGHFDLYYDTPPPANVLRSWRFASSVPDASRPDLLLHEPASGRVAVLDAKYRVDRVGAASEDSRKDVTSYLGLYGIDAIGIVYPGSGEAAGRATRGTIRDQVSRTGARKSTTPAHCL